jgi:methionyl-tRNA synthetase
MPVGLKPEGDTKGYVMTQSPIPPAPEQPLPAAQSPVVPPLPVAPAAPAAKPIIAYDDFAKLDIRTAKVLEVRDHPNADKLLVVEIDLGDGQKRTVIAGLKPYMPPQSLVGKTVIVLANLQPRKMRGLESNGMLLAASFGQESERKVVVLTTDSEVPPGSPVS